MSDAPSVYVSRSSAGDAHLSAERLDDGGARAGVEIRGWPGYSPTPLVRLAGLARHLGIADVWCKDETDRFGLGSFKALGGAYAVFRHLARELEARGRARPTTLREMQTPEHRAACRAMTVTCATAGNHGRAVAWGARLCGCASVIFLPAAAGAARADALAALGARVLLVHGGYDDALRAATAAAADHGWHVVSDTSAEGARATAADVMDGYTVLFDELVEALPRDALPTHLFVQAGVGSLAAAACSFVARTVASHPPAVVIVEPTSAACLLASARAGALVTLGETPDTIMGGLACRAPSPLAWEAIAPVARFYLTISDDVARRAMRLLADGVDGDRQVVAGPSGAAGAAGLIAACEHPDVRGQLGLTGAAAVIVIATEAAHGASAPATSH